MGENIKTKKNFFSKVIKSIKDFEKYEDFALEGTKESLKYILKLTILFSIVLSIVSSYLICKNANIIYQDFKNVGANFSFKDNKLSVESENPILIQKYNNFFGAIVIDTSEDVIEEEAINKIKQYNNGIILLKDKMVISNNVTNSTAEFKYSEFIESIKAQYKIQDIEINNKEEVINKIDKINRLSIIIAIFFTIILGNIIIYFIDFITYSLILALLAYLIARISRIKMSFSNSFGIAVHALTLSIVLNLVYSIIKAFTGFEIKYFDWMYNTISYIYVIVAILMIKTDFINRQMELLKITESEKEIKEEKKQEDEKPPVEDDEKENDKEKDDGQEDSLNGSEA